MESNSMIWQKKNLARRKIKALKLQNSNYARQLKEACSEIEVLKRNNVELAKTIQRTKEQNAMILQEKFKLDSAHHELFMKYVPLKNQVEKFKLAVRSIDDELTNVAIPGLVAFSDCIKCFKFRVNECLADVDNSEDNGTLPRQSEPIFMNRSSAHQQSSTVNPMIQGYIIQKPVINIQRIPTTIADDNSTVRYEIARPSRSGDLSRVPEETSAEIMAEANTAPAPSRRGGLRYTLNIFNKNNSASARNKKENPLNKSPQLAPTLFNASDDSSVDEDESVSTDTYSRRMSNLPYNKDKLKEENELDDERSVRSSPLTNYDPLEGPSWRYRAVPDENEQTVQSGFNSRGEEILQTSMRRNNNESRRTSGIINESNRETMNGNLTEVKTTRRESDEEIIPAEENGEFPGFESEDKSPSIQNTTDFLEKPLIFPNVATRRKKTARQESVSTRLRSSRSSSKNDDSTLEEIQEIKPACNSYNSFKMTSEVDRSSPLDLHEISNNNSSDDRSNITRKRGGRKGSNKNRRSTPQSNSNFVSFRRERGDSSSNEITNGSNTNGVYSEGFSSENSNIENRRPKRAALQKVPNYQEPSLNKKLRR